MGPTESFLPKGTPNPAPNSAYMHRPALSTKVCSFISVEAGRHSFVCYVQLLSLKLMVISTPIRWEGLCAAASCAHQNAYQGTWSSDCYPHLFFLFFSTANAIFCYEHLFFSPWASRIICCMCIQWNTKVCTQQHCLTVLMYYLLC